jgi:ribonuclease D
MEPEIRWITRSDELAALVEGLGVAPLALDSEADSMHHYPEKVCLVQLSVDGTDYLLDPLAGLDLAPLAPVLGDAARPKILHGADYDLRVLDRDFGIRIRGLFDTMVAARLLGESAFGLAALLERHLGVRLDKRFQRADWSRRPLPDEMVRYAVMDTRHLQPLAAMFQRRLEQTGRTEWAAEEFRRLEQVRWTDNEDAEPYRRVKGSSSLDPRGLATLRELWIVREAEARRRDRPPFKIMHNDVLLALARKLPGRHDELEQVRGVPPSWRKGERSARLLAAVARALELPRAELPEPRIRRRRPRNGPLEKRLKKLCTQRDAVARELGIEPSMLSSRAVLEQVAQRMMEGRDPATVEGLRSWQAEQLESVFRRREPRD